MLEKTILIVDDDQAYLREISGLLSKFGYRVAAHSSERDILRKIRISKPDLVLLGIKLDEKSRFQIVDELSFDPSTSHIPIITMNEDPASTMFLKLLNFIGVGRWLAKPAKPGEIVARIEVAVNEQESQVVRR